MTKVRTVKFNPYYNNVKFDLDITKEEDMKTYASFHKAEGLTLDFLLREYFSLDTEEKGYWELVELYKKVWPDVKPLTPTEVMKNYTNTEQRLVLLSIFEPEEIVNDMDATLVHEETITKNQFKTILKDKDPHNKTTIGKLKASDIEKVKVEYQDTYQLYRAPASKFGLEEDIFFVKCKDSTSDKYYYLYVQPHNDAIAAIASTYRKPDGTQLTKEEYLSSKLVTET